MQYSVSHVATTALVLSQMVSEGISEHLISKIFLGEHAPRPSLVLHTYGMHTYTSDIHVTPHLKILAKGLGLTYKYVVSTV